MLVEDAWFAGTPPTPVYLHGTEYPEYNSTALNTFFMTFKCFLCHYFW